VFWCSGLFVNGLDRAGVKHVARRRYYGELAVLADHFLTLFRRGGGTQRTQAVMVLGELIRGAAGVGVETGGLFSISRFFVHFPFRFSVHFLFASR
jgi:hypothetical protein